MVKRTFKELNGTYISEENYSYDAASNLTSARNTNFVYDTNNRLTAYGNKTVSYDADGNMLSDGSMTYEYDSANRLIKAGDNEYTYNAEDVRIRNLCGEYDTTYVYDTNVKLSRLLQKTTNGVTTKYVYGLGLIGQEKEYCFRTYHFDYRGSTVAITDMYGNVTDRFEYDTYGKVISHTGNSFVIFGFNGRDGVVTDKNGLLYMRARYYSPDMQRFINADVIHGKISRSVTLNRYAYANGNPVSNIDPFGLSAERGATVEMPNSLSPETNGRSLGEKLYESIDIDNDGIYDCYVYSYTYTYTESFLFWKTQKTLSGKVYIYVNVTTAFFEDASNRPEGFNANTDLMIADFTSSEKPTLYAYAAHKVDAKCRQSIIDIMQQYDEDFSTDFNRTDASLMTEWEGHHKYRLAKSARNIDFDNAEEDFTAEDYDEKAFNRVKDFIHKILDKLESIF